MDGVLCKTMHYYADRLHKEKQIIADPENYLFWTGVPGYMTAHEFNMWARPKNPEGRKDAEIQNGARLIMSILSKEHEIWIITARKSDTEHCPHTLQWLKKHRIFYNQLHHKKEKAAFCKVNNIDLLIDDEPNQIVTTAKNTPVIIFHHKYNAYINPLNSTRAKGWIDVLEIVKKINNSKN